MSLSLQMVVMSSKSSIGFGKPFVLKYSIDTDLYVWPVAAREKKQVYCAIHKIILNLKP